ncbi:MAG: cytochrome c maturation protein CcmE [Candidatus Palauibacterales bacterium]|nr:cytochrome c maturation protein CcmE [Candidatus Palauibacterales bacterium]
MSKSKKIWAGIGVLAIAGGIALLIAGGLSTNVVYFLTPSELRAELAERGDEIVNQPLRLGGQVKPGSLTWNADQLDLRFVVTDSIGEVPVRSTGAPPAMFKEGIGVVVEGRYTHDGIFESTNLMVKHSNEYEPPHGEKPAQLYESLIKSDS